MAKAIQIQINADLLDLSKAYKGKKGNYLTLSGILNDEPDQYGNYGFIKQFTTKEEAPDMPILGNMKLNEFDRRRVSNYDNLPPQNKVQVEQLKESPDLDILPF